MKIAGGHRNYPACPTTEIHYHRQLIVITWTESAASAADSSGAFTMSWNL